MQISEILKVSLVYIEKPYLIKTKEKEKKRKRNADRRNWQGPLQVRSCSEAHSRTASSASAP